MSAGPPTGKTPISLLQEFCVKRSITPVYDLIANEGPVHEPLFVFQCRAGSFCGVGRGVSKKRAKHNAAHATLVKMLNDGAALTEPECATISQLCQTETAPSGSSAAAAAAAASAAAVAAAVASADGSSICGDDSSGVTDAAAAAAYLANLEEDDEEAAGNPIGELQELCQRRLWPQAGFQFACTIVPGQTSQFVCTASLWRWEQQACARSKRLAKRRAAQALLDRIRAEKLTIPQEELDLLEEAEIPVGRGAGEATRSASPARLSATAGTEIGRLFSGLRARKGGPLLGQVAAVSNVQDDNGSDEVVQCPKARLEALASAHRFALEFHDLAVGHSGLTPCLLRLGTAPPLAAVGSGATAEAARIQACRAALEALTALTDPRGRPI